MSKDEPLFEVCVRRHWNDHRAAAIPADYIEGLHWDRVSGGIHSLAPQPFIHGYVSCERIEGSGIPHSCQHGSGPHSIKVCIVRKDNERVWARLLEIVGPRP